MLQLRPTQKVVEQLIDGIHFVSNLAKKYATEGDAEKVIQDKMMNYFLEGIEKIGCQRP